MDEILRVLRPDMLQVDVGELAALTLPRTLAGVAGREHARRRRLTNCRTACCSSVRRRTTATGWDEDGIRGLSRRTRLVLAGGLDADNVGPLVRDLTPFGVDVSRGVEIAPGIKGLDLIRRFVQAVRTTHGAIAI